MKLVDRIERGIKGVKNTINAMKGQMTYNGRVDSWSGSSIRNLFAEPDDPDVQQRIQEKQESMTVITVR